MTPSSPRRCAVALLCAALVLAAVCARAASIVVNGDISQSGDTFNGDKITFELDSVRADVVTVQLMNSKVAGDGLTIQGYINSVPAAVTTRISMSVTSTTVTSSVIAFTDYMPPNSDIRLAATTGTLTAAQSLFDFSGLTLEKNVTVTVEESSVTWPSGSTNTGSIVTYNSGGSGSSISKNSALFILNATATNGASVLHISTGSVFPVSDSSVLAVDYGHCIGCSSAMVDIGVALQVDGSSVFRVTKSTVVGGDKGLLSSTGEVSVTDQSLYLIADCIIEAGSFFNFADSGDTAFKFVVTQSTVSFLDLVGPSTGILSPKVVPTTNDGTGVVIAGGCTIADTALTTIDAYREKGIDATKVVDSNGAADSTCANAQCVPGHSKPGSPEEAGIECSCTCTERAYNPPACTTASDPTQTYDDTATCTVLNCATCDRLYPSSRCTQCNPGYEPSPTYQCDATTTTTTTTTAVCNVQYCIKCDPNDGSKCTVCAAGWYLIPGGTCSPVECRVADCVECITGDPTKCARCAPPKIVDTVTFQCITSGSCSVSHCKTCSPVSASVCDTCDAGYTLSADKTTCTADVTSTTTPTTPCSVPNCITCVASDPNTCQYCRSGYYTSNGQCVQGPECRVGHCTQCKGGSSPTSSGSDPESTCVVCESGYTLTNGYCVASSTCTVANCAACSNSPDQCTTCNPGFRLVNGTCSPVECRVADCVECITGDPTKCARCAPPKIVDTVTFQCITSGSCSVSHCKTCSPVSASVCDTCDAGYTLSADKTTCTADVTSTTTPTTPCSVPNCITCVASDPNTCQYCRSGYYTSNGQCVPTSSCYVGNCAQCMLRDSTKCSTCRNGYLLSSTYTCLSQHVNVNGAVAPHSRWVAVAVMVAFAVTYLA